MRHGDRGYRVPMNFKQYLLFPVSFLSLVLTLGVRLAHGQLSTTGAVQVSIGLGGVAPAVIGLENEPYSHQVVGAPNGDLVFFSSAANNLVAAGIDENTLPDIYKYSPTSGIELISLSPTTGKSSRTGFSGSVDPAVSPTLPDGSYAVAFVSDATDLIQNYTQTSAGTNSSQVYLRLPSINQTVLVSKGVPTTLIAAGLSTNSPPVETTPSGPTSPTGIFGANQGSSYPSVALLGTSPTRYLVAFSSFATNIGTSGSGNSQFERIFTAVVTVTNGVATCSDPELLFDPRDGDMRTPELSGDGNFIVFSSRATILSGISNGIPQIYSYDRVSKTFQLISKSSLNQPGNALSDRPTVSYQGNFILFRTRATDLITNSGNEILVRYDRKLGTFSQVNTSSAGTPSNGSVFYAAIHPNGRFVAFSDSGTNLVSTPVSSTQTYFKDITSGEIILASQNSTGQPGSDISGSGVEDFSYEFRKVSIGATGFTSTNAFVPFTSGAPNLATAGVPTAFTNFAFSSPIKLPARKLTKGALIESPADVSITRVFPRGQGARVKFFFTKFEIDESAFLSRGRDIRASATKLQYSLELRKVGSRQRITRLTSRNSLTINKVSPGRYTVRYRVEATKGRRKVRSNYSPKTSLVVPKS